MIKIQKTRNKRLPSQNTFGKLAVLYWTQPSRIQFGVSINVWRLAGDTLNITCNFLYCNHQVHRGFLITLYMAMSTPWRRIDGIESMAPVIFKIGVRWMWVVKFTPRDLPCPGERATDSHWTGSWVSPTVCLEVFEEWKILNLICYFCYHFFHLKTVRLLKVLRKISWFVLVSLIETLRPKRELFL
jgi:hypothetical protein